MVARPPLVVASGAIREMPADDVVPFEDLPVGTTSSTVARGDAGVPTGGAAGAVLVKRSATSYDEEWAVRSIAQLRATASQTIATASSWTSVAFAAEDVDEDNGHDLTTNNSRWTAPRAMTVKVGAQASWVGGQSTTSPARSLRLARNGAAVLGSVAVAGYTAAGLTQIIMPMFVPLAAGQYLELQAFTALANAQLYSTTTDYAALMTIEQVR